MYLYRLFLTGLLAGFLSLSSAATQAQAAKSLTVLFTGDLKGWATPLQA